MKVKWSTTLTRIRIQYSLYNFCGTSWIEFMHKMSKLKNISCKQPAVTPTRELPGKNIRLNQYSGFYFSVSFYIFLFLAPQRFFFAFRFLVCISRSFWNVFVNLSTICPLLREMNESTDREKTTEENRSLNTFHFDIKNINYF